MNEPMRCIYTCIILFVVQLTYAQTFEEEYNKFRDKAIGDYVDFRKKANEEYAAFMKEAWEEYKVIPKLPLTDKIIKL